MPEHPDSISSQVNIDTQDAEQQAQRRLEIMEIERQERQRVEDSAARQRVRMDMANDRAATQPLPMSSRLDAGLTLTAPANAPDAFDYAAYEASRRTGEYVNRPVPPPATESAAPPEDRWADRDFGRADAQPGPWVEDTGNAGPRPKIGQYDPSASGDWRERFRSYGQQAREALLGERTQSAAPRTAPRYADFEAAQQAKADILRDAQNRYTAEGRVDEIGGEGFNREVEEANVAAGLAKRETFAGRYRKAIGGFGGAFGLAYGGSALLTGAAQGIALTQSGNYVTPEQQTASAAGIMPGVGSLIGMGIGALAGPEGALVGQFLGQGVGSVAEASVKAGAERSESTRQVAEQLTAALGETTSRLKEFSAQVEATGAPVKQLQSGLNAVGAVGNFGAGSITGTGRLVNAFGENSDRFFGAITKYTSDPLLYGLGSRFAAGDAGSADITALGYDAAENADFGGLKTLQQAARDARVKDDPEFQRLAGEYQRRGRAMFGLGGFFQQHEASWGYDVRLKEGMDARRAALDGQDDPDVRAQNTLIGQFAASRVQRIVAEAGVGSAQAGVSLVENRGGSAADVEAASGALYAKLGDARAAALADVARLRADQALPVNAGRRDELEARIADAQARADGYSVTDAQRRRQNFQGEIGEEQSNFALADTQGVLGGRSAADLLYDRERQASFLEGTALDPRNPLRPSERADMQERAARYRYNARVSVYDERLGQDDVAIGRAGAEVGRQRAFGSAASTDAAMGRQVEAFQAKIAELNQEIQSGTLTVSDRIQKEKELTQTQQQAVQAEAQRRDERVRNAQAFAGDDFDIATAGQGRQIRRGGSASVDRGAVDKVWQGRLDADQYAISQYASGSRERKDAEARLARDRADFDEDNDRLNVYTPDVRTRMGDTAGDLALSKAEHAFRRASEAPYTDAGGDPFTRANDLLGQLGRSEKRLTDDFGKETAQRARLIKSGRWNDLAEEGYQDDLARNDERIEGLKDRRADIEHDRLEALFGALPEMIAGSPGRGLGSALIPTAALSARFAPNAGVGNWGRTATWWGTPGASGGSPYGHAGAGGTDGGSVPGASGGNNEGNRYLAVIAEGIGTLVRQAASGGGFANHTTMPHPQVGSAVHALTNGYNPNTGR